MPVPSRSSSTPSSQTKGGQTTTWTRSCVLAASLIPCSSATASPALVGFIFQFPAKMGLFATPEISPLFVLEHRHAGQLLALHRLQGRAAARGDVGEAGDAEPGHRRR